MSSSETTPKPAPAGRKAQTQERILRAAMDLFLRRGYERTSVTQIANKAGVSRGAVFWHFGDKDTLFRTACKQFLVPFRETLTGGKVRLEPRKRLFELFAVYEGFVEHNRQNVEAFVRWVLDSPEHSRALREDLLSLHDAYRGEIEGALHELGAPPGEAAEIADGFLSLLDGNLFLLIFGGAASNDERRRAGLRAVAERVLRELEER